MPAIGLSKSAAVNQQEGIREAMAFMVTTVIRQGQLPLHQDEIESTNFMMCSFLPRYPPAREDNLLRWKKKNPHSSDHMHLGWQFLQNSLTY
jgi:hypothetical protein